MNNGMKMTVKMTVKILLIVIIPTFCYNEGHYKIRGEKYFEHKRVHALFL